MSQTMIELYNISFKVILMFQQISNSTYDIIVVNFLYNIQIWHKICGLRFEGSGRLNKESELRLTYIILYLYSHDNLIIRTHKYELSSKQS
jgi:hypothetical protein